MQANILTISDIFKKEKLSIPQYQRPYTWSTKSAIVLLNDIYKEFQSNKNEYRIGSIILHEENNVYNIVDGNNGLLRLR